mgnify:FL=1
MGFERLIAALVKLTFVLLGVMATYIIGGHWISFLSTILSQLTLASLIMGIIEPIVLFLMWVFIIGVLSVD